MRQITPIFKQAPFIEEVKLPPFIETYGFNQFLPSHTLHLFLNIPCFAISTSNPGQYYVLNGDYWYPLKTSLQVEEVKAHIYTFNLVTSFKVKLQLYAEIRQLLWQIAKDVREVEGMKKTWT